MTNNNLDVRFSAFAKDMRQSKSKDEIDRITKAWEFACLAHTGQKRFSGDEYVSHSLEVALLLYSWKLDTDSIVAGLLHDTVEDGGATKQDIEESFGEEIARLVNGVTKITSIRWSHNKDDYFAENLRKMVLFIAKDIRVVLIKLADRLHNMRTLWAVKPEKRSRIAHETIEIYSPLADRLGMGEVYGELNDLAFQYAYPSEYESLTRKSKPYYKAAGKHIIKMRRTILRYLADEGIKADVEGREKRVYSLWKKLQRKEIDGDFEKIHDIVALRILVDNVAQCYTALGVVHSHFKPVPFLGISDFIAQPKPNGYKSIHTKVFGPNGRIVEVQIRTHEMHDQAEHGVAAHWAYSQAKEKSVSDEVLEKQGVKADVNKLSWVKQLVEWQKEITDSSEYVRAVKFDAFSHRNFVFSPEGDVYDLPAGATPIDYAFAVHTSLPQYAQAAKVNGKIVPLSYKLQGGEMVEIIKTKNKKPYSHDWLNFVVTTTARREINKSLRKDG